MAPRTAKAKKAADVKVAENEVPKKGKGRKVIEEIATDLMEVEESETVTAVEKKTKRGKKGTNHDNIQTNGATVDSDAPAKKNKKKNVEEDDNSVDSASPSEEFMENDDLEEVQPISRGRKKPTKKEVEKKEPRGRKTVKVDKQEKEVTNTKPKVAAKGRGRKVQPKNEEQEDETPLSVEEEKPVKGRKKGGKMVKEKSPDNEKEESPDQDEGEEEAPVDEPKKRGRKMQKKAKEENSKDNNDLNEEVPATKKRKVAKKDEKGKGDSKDDDEVSEGVEVKPVRGKKGQKKAVDQLAEGAEPQDTGEKRRRKAADDKAPSVDSKKKVPAKNKTTTDYIDLDFSNSSRTSTNKEWNLKIASWNVDGIRAWLNKGGLEYIQREKPDILCLQETKCSQDKLPEEIANMPGYHGYWLDSDKDGYAGVGICTTKLAMNVQYGLQNKELDAEGRIITAEYEQFYLICTYVPNAGRKLVTLPKRLQWNDEFRKYVKDLDRKKPVIICGDMNVAHNEIDLANPKTNKKNAGFTEEERSGMTDLLGDGFVDTFRHLNPDKTGAYSFWTYMMNSRSKNVGWRLDYFIVSERLLPSLCDSVIRDLVYGSDHCPITLFLHLTTAAKPKE